MVKDGKVLDFTKTMSEVEIEKFLKYKEIFEEHIHMSHNKDIKKEINKITSSDFSYGTKLKDGMLYMDIFNHNTRIEITFNKLTHSYLFDITRSDENDKKENIKYIANYLDNAIEVKTSRKTDYNEYGTTMLINRDKEGNEKETELIYEYVYSPYFSYMLEENLLKNGKNMVTLTILTDDNVPVNIRGIRKDNHIKFIEGNFLNINLNENVTLNATSVNGVIEGVAQLLNMNPEEVFKNFSCINSLFDIKLENNPRNKETVLTRFLLPKSKVGVIDSALRKLEIPREEFEEYKEKFNRLSIYKNEFDEEITELIFENGNKYTYVEKRMPIFYLTSEEYKAFTELKPYKEDLKSRYVREGISEVYSMTEKRKEILHEDYYKYVESSIFMEELDKAVSSEKHSILETQKIDGIDLDVFIPGDDEYDLNLLNDMEVYRVIKQNDLAEGIRTYTFSIVDSIYSNGIEMMKREKIDSHGNATDYSLIYILGKKSEYAEYDTFSTVSDAVIEAGNDDRRVRYTYLSTGKTNKELLGIDTIPVELDTSELTDVTVDELNIPLESEGFEDALALVESIYMIATLDETNIDKDADKEKEN